MIIEDSEWSALRAIPTPGFGHASNSSRRQDTLCVSCSPTRREICSAIRLSKEEMYGEDVVRPGMSLIKWKFNIPYDSCTMMEENTFLVCCSVKLAFRNFLNLDGSGSCPILLMKCWPHCLPNGDPCKVGELYRVPALLLEECEFIISLCQCIVYVVWADVSQAIHDRGK